MNDNTVILLPMQLSSAISLQTLALPGTLALCIISMLRERSIGGQDEKRLVRLYKQHAVVLELAQFLVALMACGFIVGNTVAALEARSLVVGFASEDVTAMIVRTALVRNLWLSVSAFCTLTCMNMLDSWSLPRSFPDVTDPLFRLTRELVAAYIWRRETSYQENDSDPFFKDLERRCPPVEPTKPAPDEKSPTTITTGDISDKAATPLELPTKEENDPKETSALPPLFSHSTKTSPKTTSPPSHDLNPAPLFASTTKTSHPNPPSAAIAYPPASRPHYQAPTQASALRIVRASDSVKPTKPSLTPKSSNGSLHQKDRARKRSVTFALQPLSSEDKEESRDVRKRSSSVRDRVRKLEFSVIEERSTTLGKRVEVGGEKGDGQDAGECGVEESEMTKSFEDEEMVIVDDSDATVVGSEVVEGDEKEEH